ncbi:MAG: UDP-glucose/GDP-mannose dehydrogenase family protein [Verrucomicrobiota bacterium]
MKISIIGTGYVGLVSGVCMAAKGHDVVCVDLDQAKVDQINAGRSPIHEKGLDELLQKHCGVNFRATTDLRAAVLGSEISMIAVGTPFDGDEIDLKYIRAAARQIGTALKDKPDYHVVLVKSTVVPGTTSEVVLPLVEEGSGKQAGRDFGVGMNPEFLREGEAVQDFMQPDRIVLGGMDERTLDVLAELYSPFSDVDQIRTNPRTAEMIKYTANSLLATMISFSNEIGNLCAAIPDVDVTEVMRGVHLDKRLSPILADGTRITPSFTTYIEAGCGFGGSCFPKDVKALIAHGRKLGKNMQLLDAVVKVNIAQPDAMLKLLSTHFDDLEGVRVAVLGIAFKPGTDDIRESPALPVVDALLAGRAIVTAFDPIAREEAEKRFGAGVLDFAETLEDAVEEADAVLLLTRWPEFSRLPEVLAGCVRQPVLIDGRRMVAKDSVERYEGIGLGPETREAVASL